MNILKTIHAQLPLTEGDFRSLVAELGRVEGWAGWECVFVARLHTWGSAQIERFSEDVELVQSFWAFLLEFGGAATATVTVEDLSDEDVEEKSCMVACDFDQYGSSSELFILGLAHFYREDRGAPRLRTFEESGTVIEFNLTPAEMAEILRAMYP